MSRETAARVNVRRTLAVFIPLLVVEFVEFAYFGLAALRQPSALSLLMAAFFLILFLTLASTLTQLFRLRRALSRSTGG